MIMVYEVELSKDPLEKPWPDEILWFYTWVLNSRGVDKTQFSFPINRIDTISLSKY